MLSRFVRSVCAVTLLALAAAPAVAQTPLDKRILFTFNAPVTIPGVTLPPGTYMFHVADAVAGRSVVQVRSKDGRQVYSTFLTIPYETVERPNDPEIRFMERRANVPYAVRGWWYPGERTGFEPIYPRKQAELLAKSVNDPVLTTSATAAALIEANSLSRISADGETSVSQ
jgi:hypothetical protein